LELDRTDILKETVESYRISDSEAKDIIGSLAQMTLTELIAVSLKDIRIMNYESVLDRGKTIESYAKHVRNPIRINKRIYGTDNLESLFVLYETFLIRNYGRENEITVNNRLNEFRDLIELVDFNTNNNF
jgi:hypothetical protein